MPGLSRLLELHQSLWLLLAGGALLWAAGAFGARGRRAITIALLIVVGMMAMLLPLDQSRVTMGEARERAESRASFERYYGGDVRFEQHLSQTLLRRLYRRDPADAAPRHALLTLGRLATMWFLLSALAIGMLEAWSPLVLRYLGLALLAPATLMYFGWMDFGYLSLNVAAFPLIVRGLRDGGTRLEAGSALAGVGAALHGSGLIALAGACLAAVTAPLALKDRLDRVLRIIAWGTAAYVGWVAIYVIVLKEPIQVGPAGSILSAAAARDAGMAAWVVGMPLLIVAASLRRRFAPEVRAALWYAVPSILFTIAHRHVHGLGTGMALAFAGFPAVYALAWVCAHDAKRALMAAAILVSAHLAFWRVVLS